MMAKLSMLLINGKISFSLVRHVQYGYQITHSYLLTADRERILTYSSLSRSSVRLSRKDLFVYPWLEARGPRLVAPSAGQYG